MPAPARVALRCNGGSLASVALVIMWSSGFVGAELGIRSGGTPLQLLNWRFSILAVLLLTVCMVFRVDLTDRRAWGRQAMLGLFSQAGFLFLIFEGVNRGVDGGIASGDIFALLADVSLDLAEIAGGLEAMSQQLSETQRLYIERDEDAAEALFLAGGS